MIKEAPSAKFTAPFEIASFQIFVPIPIRVNPLFPRPEATYSGYLFMCHNTFLVGGLVWEGQLNKSLPKAVFDTTVMAETAFCLMSTCCRAPVSVQVPPHYGATQTL